MKKLKCIITTDAGQQVEATSPVVISASRSTDIPAFYSDWFFNRLKKGYCAWINPFNQRREYVSFDKCKVIVFWTKNPKPIIPFLHELDERGIHYYFQVTLNDYEDEGFEPNVPPLTERVDTFRSLASLIGRERVIWRFDPLIVASCLTPKKLLRKICKVGNLVKGFTDKLVFSFVDIHNYRRVQFNLVKETSFFTPDTVMTAELSEFQRREVVDGLLKLQKKWHDDGWNVDLATCAEEDNYEGIKHNCCIDRDLMARLFADDKALVYYLNTGELPELDLFGNAPILPKHKKNLKDKGQRKVCGCMISKDIGMYNTCRHFCVYCYANGCRTKVLQNCKSHQVLGESIIESDC